MNILKRSIVLTALASAIALPAIHAAKANRKNTETPSPAFASVDKDGNGDISQSEFVAAMKDKLGDEAAKTKFAELDKDHDGKLSKEEFASGATEPQKKKKRKKDAN